MTDKLAYWRQLPHFLAVLASTSRDIVQRAAARCLRLYDAVAEELHHPLSRLFLSPTYLDSLRGCVVELVGGNALSSLPRVAQLLIKRARFWSTLDTPIEEKHARLSKVVSRVGRFSPQLMSSALRLPPFIREVGDYPDLMK
eukprot:741809-Lingulodinium_polyedra.AAC.1